MAGHQVWRRLVLSLTAVVVVAVSVVTGAPVGADESGANCDPGSDCTGFERNAYEVSEGSEYVDLAVSAAWCCPAGQGEVDYETFDGSAAAGADYQRTSGTLTYAGHGAGRIRVPIFGDAVSEGAEQFVVRLTNFRGTFVNRGYEAAVVTVVDAYSYEPAVDSAPPNGSSPETPGDVGTASSPAPTPAAPQAPGSQQRGPTPPAPLAPAKNAQVAIAPEPPAKQTGERGRPLALGAVLGLLVLATVVLLPLPFRRTRA